MPFVLRDAKRSKIKGESKDNAERKRGQVQRVVGHELAKDQGASNDVG